MEASLIRQRLAARETLLVDDYDQSPEAVRETVENSDLLEWFNPPETYPYVTNWIEAYNLLEQHHDSVTGRIGLEQDLDSVFESCEFNCSAGEVLLSCYGRLVRKEYRDIDQEIQFTADGIDVRHEVRVDDSELDEFESQLHEHPVEEFDLELEEVHIEKLSNKAYFIGGEDPTEDQYHKVWLEVTERESSPLVPRPEPTDTVFDVEYELQF